MRNHLFPIASALVLLLAAAPAHAISAGTIQLTATRLAALNDGRDSIEIVADVRESNGNMVADGTVVSFSTTLGQFLSGSSVTTKGGQARIRLQSTLKGTANVTAATPTTGGIQTMTVVFTDDPAETYQGNAYIAVQSSGALMYSAGDRIIEARGKTLHFDAEAPDAKQPPGARVTFRDIEVFADSLQIDCTQNVVRAQGNVIVRRGKRNLTCHKLYLPLMNGDGFALAEVEEKIGERTVKRLRPVVVKGQTLAAQPTTTGAIASRYFDLTDLDNAQLLVVARQILLFPGERLQFKRPDFYQDGQKIVSMMVYQLGLYSTQLFTDQFLTVGSRGLGIDMPLYYDLTPGSTGLFRFRHGVTGGRNINATQSGFFLDMNQSYNSLGGGSRYTGQFSMTGLNRSDWGARWSHNQEFSGDTRGSLSLDFPQHRSLFANGSLSRQFSGFHMGMNLSANQSIAGFPTSGTTSDFYLETNPRKVGTSGYMMAFGGTASVGHTATNGYRNNYINEGVQTRFFSQPFRLDKSTTLVNNVTVGNLWTTNGQSGLTALASLTMNRTMRSANLQMTYDFTRQPAYLTGGGTHRLSMSFFAGKSSKWSATVSGSTFLDAVNSSMLADLSYAILPRWRLSTSATLQQFSTAQYRDYTLGIGRDIGGRELILSYSTYSHKIFFDIQASRF